MLTHFAFINKFHLCRFGLGHISIKVQIKLFQSLSTQSNADESQGKFFIPRIFVDDQKWKVTKGCEPLL